MWDPIAYALGFLDCDHISARARVRARARVGVGVGVRVRVLGRVKVLASVLGNLRGDHVHGVWLGSALGLGLGLG